ncbi:spondin domain-containing protein [Catenovulum agarivorans]|uniref:spondin domain-containing protein n=1 Tax=Catenovulum agarivorans TaxID=1172192 RepID=UPI0002F5F461|nr:spondin domain-containing protein [Catenovulum agarivorans]
MKTQFKPAHSLVWLSLIAGMSVLSGCSIDINGDDDDDKDKDMHESYHYQVTVTNLTQAQPLSPVSLTLHNASTKLWMAGEMASSAIEVMAEGGDNSKIAELSAVKMAYSGDGILMPGHSQSWMIESMYENYMYLSVATMLVNTNDAFTGKTGIDLSNLEVGMSMHYTTMAYDAGTEANDEINLPGPAAGGEGYNNTRNDVDRVHIHPGVLSNAELTGSMLSPEHKFDNPVTKITITRMQ